MPTDEPTPTITGRQSGPNSSMTAATPDPVNPTGPVTERLTTERGERALQLDDVLIGVESLLWHGDSGTTRA